MKIVRGKDGRYCASQAGAMSRMAVADASTRPKAAERCADLLLEQQSEAYHHEQSMSHLAEIQPYGAKQ